MDENVLQKNGRVVPTGTVRPLTISEIYSPSEKKMREEFDNAIKIKLGDSLTAVEDPTKPDIDDEIDELMDEDDESVIIPEEDPVDHTGKTVYEQPFTDMLISAEVLLPHQDKMTKAKVFGRSRDDDGKV